MACDITNGRVKQCKSQLGGIGSIYFFPYIADPFTLVGGQATAINAALTSIFEYEIEGDLNTLVESLVSDRNTGTTVNTQTLTVSLKAIDYAAGVQLNLLAKGYPMAVIKDRNGVFHAIGIQDGIDFTVEENTGGAKSDFNGYTLTGVATTSELSPKLDSATQTAFLAAVAPYISGPASVAVAAAIQLVGSGIPAVANAWVSGTTAKATVVNNNTNTVYVTGVATGTSVITYTDINGNTATKTITVTA